MSEFRQADLVDDVPHLGGDHPPPGNGHAAQVMVLEILVQRDGVGDRLDDQRIAEFSLHFESGQMSHRARRGDLDPLQGLKANELQKR